MTRINLLSVKDLSNQHLIAEWRELPRIFTLVKTKLNKNQEIKPWEKYKMWTGHVKFFYDKLLFLQKRHKELTQELLYRKFNISNKNEISLDEFPKYLCNDYKPSDDDIEVSKTRIEQKINQKPDFYVFRK